MTGPQRFRKKPVEIEAMQWVHDAPQSAAPVLSWIREHSGVATFAPLTGPAIVISTLEGDMHASSGDWIIRGVQGEFYPCKPDIFAQTYDDLEAAAHPISSGRILVEGSGLTVGKPPMTATVQVRVVAEGEPVAGVILGTVNLIAPPQHVDEVRAAITRALS